MFLHLWQAIVYCKRWGRNCLPLIMATLKKGQLWYYKGQAHRSQMNNLCTKQPLNKERPPLYSGQNFILQKFPLTIRIHLDCVDFQCESCACTHFSFTSWWTYPILSCRWWSLEGACCSATMVSTIMPCSDLPEGIRFPITSMSVKTGLGLTISLKVK